MWHKRRIRALRFLLLNSSGFMVHHLMPGGQQISSVLKSFSGCRSGQDAGTGWSGATNGSAIKVDTANRQEWRAIRAYRLTRSHQMAQREAGAIGVPVLQPKAFWNSGRFTTTPFTRKSSGECGSVCTRSRRSSGRLFWHQPCP